MNKKEKLLADTLGDTNSEQFAHAAAAHARRRRMGRQAGLVTGLGLAIAAAIFSTREPRTEPALAAPSRAPILQTISDQELMAQLRDQPVLYLKDQARITEVVFLTDQKANSKL